MKRLFLPAAALLLAAGVARAEGPVAPQGVPPGGPDPMEEIREAALRISKALKENEEALTKLARGEKADPKPVDLNLPPKDGAKPPPQATPSDGGSGTSESESLRKTSEQGKVVVEGINKILETAAKMGSERKSSSGGGGGESGKDPQDSPRNSKKDQEKKKDPLKDNKPEDGKPESGDKPKNPNDIQGAKPPDPPKKSPPPVNGGADFLAKLPDKVREAIENGDFDQIPEKYRDLIREWTKALSEQDKKDTGATGGR